MKHHLLLIDDDDDEFELLKLALSDYPELKYSYADNGFTGIEMIKSEAPDLVLLDVNMPKMNGLKCLEKIRKDADAALRTVPVFIYSNSDAEVLTTEAMQLGATDCLRKPVSLALLKELLIKVLRNL
ncbi:response regulator [Flavobacterium sp. 3HN19-14]|uniref:response regulator n=1 Tax=Flavobacterium sp. 3HN19-14 TaxID=3448133 RepID=UPI003EDFEE50